MNNEFFVPAGKKDVTVYLHPGKMEIQYTRSNASAAMELMSRIRQEFARKAGVKMPETLDMHVCLVFDEAGSSYCKAWFENKEMLAILCDEASKLASSVTVVVVGTGITGRELSSSNDAYVFRMKPWEAADLSQLLRPQKDNLCLAEHETIDTVANAIFAHPQLGALATNGRAASFLVKAVALLSASYSRLSWDLQLNEWTSALVTQVVGGYVSLNGIQRLKSNQRRRVAASVFRAVKMMKQGDASLPTFSELAEDEIPVAESLLQYNLERGVEEKVQIVSDATFAFTLTPAIVVVLYTMAGIYTALMPGWKFEEELAALYAVRQSMVQCMERFVAGLNDGFNRQDCLDELDKSLKRVRLVRLQEKLQSKSKNVIVPMVDGETIMMNRDMASFADVIAPNTLIQAKHTKSPNTTLDVNLYEELNKCGLVKDHDSNTRLIRGLIALWQNTIDLNVIGPKPTLSSQSNQVERNPQYSKAFPENVLSLVPSKDPIQYAVIEGETGTTMTLDNDGTRIPLPELNGATITFILSTNAKQLRLDLGPSIPKVTITEAHLDDEMEINVDKLENDEEAVWTAFVRERLRDGVNLKFLFTT